jgi:ABC-type lipoprotein export system ATPase subunit
MEGEAILVHADGLTRTFGSGRAIVTALADATFAVRPKDGIALIGPSGSGKSTVIHLIAALDQPTKGSIVWPALGERDALRPGPVAVAFQGPSLLPPLTVLENVALPVILGGGDEGEATAQARDLLEVFEVDGLAEKLPEELSGGQAQRAGLARAFAGSPRLVLADEPTGQQDGVTGGHLIDAVLTLAALGDISLVIATHDPAVAERFPIRWSMRDGHLKTETLPCSA